jgi:hypothetical protein
MGGRRKVGRLEGWKVGCLLFVFGISFFRGTNGWAVEGWKVVFVLELTFFEERMGGRLKVEK